jgi:hypothetical protein
MASSPLDASVVMHPALVSCRLEREIRDVWRAWAQMNISQPIYSENNMGMTTDLRTLWLIYLSRSLVSHRREHAVNIRTWLSSVMRMCTPTCRGSLIPLGRRRALIRRGRAPVRSTSPVGPDLEVLGSVASMKNRKVAPRPERGGDTVKWAYAAKGDMAPEGSPISDETSIFPPISVASCLETNSPRPEPPNTSWEF